MKPNNVTELVALRSQRHESRDERRRALEAAGVRVRFLPKKVASPVKAAAKPAKTSTKRAPAADPWKDPAALFAERDRLTKGKAK